MMQNKNYTITMLGLGLAISALSKSQGQAMMTVFAILFPAIILSDFFFPVENMPTIVEWATNLNSMRYAIWSQREVFLKGNGLWSIKNHLSYLSFFAIIFYSYGALYFNKTNN